MPYRGVHVVDLHRVFRMVTESLGHTRSFKAAEICGKPVWQPKGWQKIQYFSENMAMCGSRQYKNKNTWGERGHARSYINEIRRLAG
jgi:hypothetical protein